MFSLYLKWVRSNISLINPSKIAIYWGFPGTGKLNYK